MSNLRPIETPSTVETAIAELNAKWIWGSVVVGLLTMQILMCVVAAILAVQSEATNVLPDYYENAVQHDNAAHSQPHLTSPE